MGVGGEAPAATTLDTTLVRAAVEGEVEVRGVVERVRICPAADRAAALVAMEGGAAEEAVRVARAEALAASCVGETSPGEAAVRASPMEPANCCWKLDTRLAVVGGRPAPATPVEARVPLSTAFICRAVERRDFPLPVEVAATAVVTRAVDMVDTCASAPAGVDAGGMGARAVTHPHAKPE